MKLLSQDTRSSVGVQMGHPQNKNPKFCRLSQLNLMHLSAQHGVSSGTNGEDGSHIWMVATKSLPH
jgi:hypothetical protein